jgi:hypothetical protein
MLPAKFGSIWPSSFRGEDFLTLANQKQELPLAAIYVGGMRRNEEIYRGVNFITCARESSALFLAHLTQRVM